MKTKLNNLKKINDYDYLSILKQSPFRGPFKISNFKGLLVNGLQTREWSEFGLKIYFTRLPQIIVGCSNWIFCAKFILVGINIIEFILESR